jgi:hypothetical protein
MSAEQRTDLRLMRDQAKALADDGVHWWDYDKVPILAGMIVALCDRILVLEQTVGASEGKK